MIDVGENFRRICQRVTAAAIQSGRDPSAVRIVAVSKTQPVAAISAAIAAGATDLGENYLQEATEKIPLVTGAVTWHMVGHLQRNKVARAAELFQIIHSLDSVALGTALARHGARQQRTLRVFIEVNVGGEATKRGVPPTAVEPLLTQLAGEAWLSIDGLMTIPPPSPSADAVRPYFRALRELRDALRPRAPANAPLRELSMGMTDDFETAIEEGATIVRIGRAIFGER